jgi:mRNA-degrading endonuclease RelE of RelBE toxin-antitoxin system
MNKIDYVKLPTFEKDFKKLFKKFRTLNEDFEVMKANAIEMYHLDNIAAQAVFKIEGFCGENYLSMKVKKFACKSLKGRGSKSGLRVIYVFEKPKNKITFIEIYYKSDQENEDKKRLLKFLNDKDK